MRKRSRTQVNLTYTRPNLYPKQLAAIFSPERIAVIEASTKSGKTTGCLVWIVEQTFGLREGQSVWWVAPVYPQAEIAFKRLKHFLRVGGMPFVANETHLTMTLVNDVVIHFKTGEKPDNLYGEDVFAVVLDEATRMREESWFAIRTTITHTRGMVRIIGNVKGRKNWAFRMARKAENGAVGMSWARITARDAVEAGILKQEEIDAAQRDLPERVFQELYGAVPGDDEGNPFGLDHIRKCVKPLSRKQPVVWGWDLAKSVDWTVGIGLDKDGRVCRFHRWQHPWTLQEKLIKEKTNGLPALVDSTGVGDPILEHLQEDGGSNFQGFKFTGISKQQLMEGLVVGVQQEKMGFPEHSKEVPIQGELESMEYTYTRSGVKYSAPPGLNDDCVMGLGLAFRLLTSQKPVQIFT